MIVLTMLLLLAQSGASTSFDKARQLQQSRRWPEAEQAYRAHLKQFGPSPEALANLGAVLVQQEKFADAVGNYQQALRLAPQLTPIHLNLGLAYMKSGRPADAAASFSQFLSKDPANRQARQLRAMAYLEAEKFDESVSDYRTLMPSDDITIRLGLATALARNGSAAEARSVLEPMLASDAPDVQFVYGQALFEEGNYQKALEVLQQVVKAKPDMAQLRFYLGAIYWRQQQTDAAIEEWRKEHRANPESFQANYTMGAALAFTNADEAEPFLRKAVKLRPKHPQSLYQLGKLLWLRSKSPDTVPMLEQAVKSQPDYREAHYLLATVYQSLGRRVEAQREFAVVKKLSEAEVQKSRDLFESGK